MLNSNRISAETFKSVIINDKPKWITISSNHNRSSYCIFYTTVSGAIWTHYMHRYRIVSIVSTVRAHTIICVSICNALILAHVWVDVPHASGCCAHVCMCLCLYGAVASMFGVFLLGLMTCYQHANRTIMYIYILFYFAFFSLFYLLYEKCVYFEWFKQIFVLSPYKQVQVQLYCGEVHQIMYVQ